MRLLELAAEGKKNGYAYGRGEKYTIEHGNDLSHVLSMEQIAANVVTSRMNH